MKVARAVRSLLGIIAGNHSIGIACGDSLKLSNLRISRSLGKFAMLEPPKHPDALHSLSGDFRRGADLLEELARLVLGPGVVMPRVWVDLIRKMREKFPRVELIMYHSLFLPVNLRYWLKVIVDQRFRKDFYSLDKEQKIAIRNFMEELGKNREGDVAWLACKNQFLKYVSLKSRMGAKGRRRKSNSNLSTPKAVRGERARDIISMNRDGVVHGCKDNLSPEERAAMPDIKSHWRTLESIIQLLDEEFELLDQSYIELCYDKDKKVLWKMLAIWELFGETEDFWKAAVDAIEKEFQTARPVKLEKGDKDDKDDEDVEDAKLEKGDKYEVVEDASLEKAE